MQHVIKAFRRLEGSKALFQVKEVVVTLSKVLISSITDISELKNESQVFWKFGYPTKKGWKKQQKKQICQCTEEASIPLDF